MSSDDDRDAPRWEPAGTDEECHDLRERAEPWEGPRAVWSAGLASNA